MATASMPPAKDPAVHLADIRQRPRFLKQWERLRHRQAAWVVECLAEALGVFLYCYAGMGAQAAYILGNLSQQNGLGSVFTVGIGYGLGVVLALVVSTGTSGGHFSPSITLVRVLFEGFPILKGIRYVTAQILGGYVAGLLVYAQWHNIIKSVEVALAPTGELELINFTPSGIAGIFGLYVNPGSNLGYVFLNEWVSDVVIGIVIFACLDPTNLFVSPSMAPWVIGIAYAVVVWGFSPAGLAANAARDVGGRLAALTIWGLDAGGGRYAAIAALTTFPATVVGYLVYDFFFIDSSRVITSAHAEFLRAHHLHREHLDGGGVANDDAAKYTPRTTVLLDEPGLSKGADS